MHWNRFAVAPSLPSTLPLSKCFVMIRLLPFDFLLLLLLLMSLLFKLCYCSYCSCYCYSNVFFVVIVFETAAVVTDVIVVFFVVVLLADMFENIVNGTRFGGDSHTPMLTVRMCRSTQQFGFIRFPKNEEHKCHAIQNTYDNTLSNILMLHISIGFVVPCLFVFRQFSCIVYIQHRSGSLRSPCEGCKVSQGSSSTGTVGPGVGCKKKNDFLTSLCFCYICIYIYIRTDDGRRNIFFAK